jgi:hypothetical protein
VLSWDLEGIRTLEASSSVGGVLLDELEPDVDLEFDALVAAWTAEQGYDEEHPYSEAQDCLDALLEARAVMAAMQAQEQRCLARLEALALESVGPDATAKITAARLRAGSFEERDAEAREGRSVMIRDLDEGMSELIQLLPTVYAAAAFDPRSRF